MDNSEEQPISQSIKEMVSNSIEFASYHSLDSQDYEYFEDDEYENDEEQLIFGFIPEKISTIHALISAITLFFCLVVITAITVRFSPQICKLVNQEVSK